ncbi:c-type cytochrome [Thiohalomonas denitrificans]|uniref:c-type cytochrome n=1 Tax=Thiohalomonas denitrificans TaxID=415747 RepID=UPI0026EDC280|nr:c-type cytochrome [Thiohalomonas denitrificans]
MKRLLALLFALLIAGPVFAAPDGGALYGRHCAACHGQDGHGGVGVPLALPDFLTNVSDTYLSRTIRHGRPGRVMPAFENLSDVQLRAIISHIRTWMPEGSMTPVHDTTPVIGDAKRGKALFAEHCAECHGANGEGGSGTGVTFSRPRDLPVIAPALHNAAFLHAATDQMIRTTLLQGRDGTPMESFLKQGLSEQDINDVVAYVRSFEEDPLPSGQHEGEEPYLSVESFSSFDETVANLKQAALGRNFRIIREQNLENGLFAEEEENARQRIVYFCNFKLINEAMKLDPRAGIFMPCRITVVEMADGTVKLMSINPKFMSQFFNNNALDEPCTELYGLYVGIMEEASL